MPPSLLHWLQAYGPAAVFVLLFLGIFGLPVPDETLLTVAGALIRAGDLGAVPTLAAAYLGAMGGITLSYVVGRAFGRSAVDRLGRWVHVTGDDLSRVERWFERSGRWLLTFGYFVPGVRHLTALVAGSAGLPAPAFARYAYSGAVLWATTFVALGWYFGETWESALARMHRHVWGVAVAVAVLVLAYALAHRWWSRRRG